MSCRTNICGVWLGVFAAVCVAAIFAPGCDRVTTEAAAVKQLCRVKYEYFQLGEECTVVKSDSPYVDCVRSKRYIPYLIAALDDQTPTDSISYGTFEKPVKVPLGHLCLDILLSMSAADSPVLTGVWDELAPKKGVAEGFYFGPDILGMKNHHVVMWDVHGRWERAYREGQLKWKPFGKK